MKRILYHGSRDIVGKPQYGLGRLHNDYGIGFYCTEDRDLACEWAVRRDQDGYVNEYVMDEEGLKVVSLLEPEFTTLHWIELLLRNRTFDLTTPLAREAVRYLHDNFACDINGADVIIGYRADDSYFSYAQDFINGSISVGQLSRALKLGDLGTQYVCVSPKAFDRIEPKGVEAVPSEIWYSRKKARDDRARREYYQMDSMKYIKNDLYMIQILDREVKADDPRIR